jgi:hypothetical protein
MLSDVLKFNDHSLSCILQTCLEYIAVTLIFIFEVRETLALKEQLAGSFGASVQLSLSNMHTGG